MSYRSIILLAAGLLLCSARLSSQSPPYHNIENANKYWYYRWRLINDFMIVGPDAGMSLPAAERNFQGNEWGQDNNGNNEGPSLSGIRTGRIKWGDCTTNLGWYMAVLATEWHNIYHHSSTYGINHDLGQTQIELFYAMQAFDRLDRAGEPFDNSAAAGVLNGFFVRDDVPDNWLGSSTNFANNDNFKKLNSGIAKGGTQSYSWVREVNSVMQVHSQMLSCVSRDQVVHLTMGLVCIIRFVDPTACISDGKGGTYKFVYEAQKILLRLLDNFDLPFFTIRYPANANLSNYFHTNGLTGALSAGDGAPDLYPAFQYIYNTYIPPSMHNSHDDNLYNSSIVIGAGTWDLYKYYQCGMGGTKDVYMAIIMAAIAPTWSFDIYIGPFVKVNVNVTSAKLAALGNCLNYELYSLLLSALHGPQAYGIHDDVMRGILNASPCYGPDNYTKSTSIIIAQSLEWSTTDRFIHPERSGFNMVSSANQGEYNGLDYMLFYNLWIINHPEQVYNATYGYYDEMNYVSSFQYPFVGSGGIRYGSKTQAYDIHAFNYFESTDNITYHTASSATDYDHIGDVNCYIGRHARLNPGFKVENGAEFHLVIDPNDNCSTGGLAYNAPPPLGRNTIDTSTNTGVIENPKANAKNDITAYPNPFKDILTLDCHIQKEGEWEIYIVNTLGQIIHTENLYLPAMDNQAGYKINLDTHLMAPGIYFVTEKSKGGIFSQKVAKLSANE